MIVSKTTRIWAVFDKESWSEINSIFGKRPGTYRLRLMSPDRAGWHPVPRLLGPDPEGTLYIGMSRTIIERVSALRSGLYGAYGFVGRREAAFSNPDAHQCSQRMPSAFIEALNRERLMVEVTGFLADADIPADYNAAGFERAAISGYAARFGESPPFNAT